MNLLALAVQCYATPRIITLVPRTAFSPPPKVGSAVIELADISKKFFERNVIKPEYFFELARAAFGTKRKTLANSLTKILGSKTMAETLLKQSGLAVTARPEGLSPDDWVRLVHSATNVGE